MTDINPEKSWDNFLKSGKVNDYLQYKNVSNVISNKNLGTYVFAGTDTVGINSNTINDEINNHTRVNGMNNYADKDKGNHNQTS